MQYPTMPASMAEPSQTSKCNSSSSISSPLRASPSPSRVTLLSLPLEIRLMIYRHVFMIYPDARCRVAHAHPSPPPYETIYRTKMFEVYFHPRSGATRVADYASNDREYRTLEEQKRRREYRYVCNIFLAILGVCKSVYREAMPLFYSETFFSTTNGAWLCACFLQGVGYDRRRHIRHISFEFSDSGIGQEVGGYWGMKQIVDRLIDAERVDTVEILALGEVNEWDIRDSARGHGNLELYKGLPIVFSGCGELERLNWLGTLRFVGNMEKLLKGYPQDLEWIKHLESKEWGNNQLGKEDSHDIPCRKHTKVEFEIPVDIDEHSSL